MRQSFVRLPHNDSENWERLCTLLNTPTRNGKDLDHLIGEISDKRNDFNCFSRLYKETDKRSYDSDGELIEEKEPSSEKDYFFGTVVPFLKDLILKLPELFPDQLRYLVKNQEDSVVLTRQQVACILSCSFFGCISDNNYPPGDWNVLNITNLFYSPPYSTSGSYLQCIINYFFRISKEMPKGNIIIHRRVLLEYETPDYLNSTKTISKITTTNQPIESFVHSSLHADFANEYIGGGVLEGCCAQEEILFAIKPECLVSMMICSKMEKNEAIIISGAEQFSTYTGYGWTFKFAGNHQDQTPFSVELNCIKNHIVAIDSTIANPTTIFEENILLRDINKVFCGLKNAKKDFGEPIEFVTGNWGCGAFGGNLYIKAIEQIIACSESEVEIIYSIFDQKSFKSHLDEFIDFLNEKKITIGELFNALKSCKTQRDIFKQMKTFLVKEHSEKNDENRDGHTDEAD